MRVADGIDFPDNAVDPTEAQRLVDRLLVGHPALVGVLFVEPDLQLGRRGVVLLQPAAEISGGFEVGDGHASSPLETQNTLERGAQLSTYFDRAYRVRPLSHHSSCFTAVQL